jgi:hypothetical protein
MREKEGLVMTVSEEISNPRATPLVNNVFPLPKSPAKATISPSLRSVPNLRPRFIVSSPEDVRNVKDSSFKLYTLI